MSALPKKKDRCPACNGRGREQILRNVYLCRTPCSACDGSGRVGDSPDTEEPKT